MNHRKPEPNPTPITILDYAPPSSIDSECAVLGSILLLPDRLDDVALILTDDDFYDDANQRLYRVMAERHAAGKRLDIALVMEDLKKQGEFEMVGGAAYLYRISQAVPNAAHAKHYAQIVREKSVFRKLIEAGTEIVRTGYEARDDIQDAVSQAEQRVFAIADRATEAKSITVREIIDDAIARLDARMRGEVTAGTVQTGFTDLDALTGGLHAGELVIIAGRPSMGKTSLAMNIAESVGVGDGKPVLVVSLESSASELADRLLCSAAEVNTYRARNGTLSKDERERIVKAAGRLSAGKMLLEDSANRSVAEIASIARRASRKLKEPVALIVIDYLQLIEPDNPKDSRQEQVAKISRRLKALGRDLNCPVLCLAQLNRAAEEAKDHRPRLSHLRESGSIEQDADVVIFVHREEYYLRGDAAKPYAGQADLIVAKQRNGPTDDVELYWDAACMRFRNPAPKRLEDEAPAETRASRERKDLF
jgi:replicative DNA helicase